MVRIDTQGAFVHATLDAPATRNALTDAMVASLGEACRLAESTPAVRALVVRGAGRSFCAGGDFSGFRSAMAEAPPAEGLDPIAASNRRFGALLEQLSALSVATIAVVEGAAIGGGCGLAACCDIVLAAADATFAMPEVSLGLPPAQIAPFVAARLGERAALHLMLTGRRIDADQALTLGLVDAVLALEALDARVLDLLNELRRAEPAALRATKAILRRRREASLADTLDFAALAFAAALRSGTATEGLKAFAAKRPAVWASP
jgi:isohexenylglutaconyl-CoA hydratase